ncbi:MAG: tyrosine-type recombinase/integrase [Kofleriaceae bacterium]|nr:tyrosine-type recombinase/integrase [Kofleriaceae bacterium]
MTNYAGSIARPPKTFTDRERSGLLRVTGEHVAGFRDHVLYSLGESTALRQHELLALNVSDVRGPDGRIKRRVILRVFKRSNRNADDQFVFLGDTVRAKISRLLELRMRAGEVLAPDSPLFVSSRGTRLSARRARSAFASWQQRAGFERRVNFHIIRHDSISYMYRQKKDIRLAQRFARHASLQSTMVYTHTSDEDLYQAVQDQPA